MHPNRRQGNGVISPVSSGPQDSLCGCTSHNISLETRKIFCGGPVWSTHASLWRMLTLLSVVKDHVTVHAAPPDGSAKWFPKSSYSNA